MNRQKKLKKRPSIIYEDNNYSTEDETKDMLDSDSFEIIVGWDNMLKRLDLNWKVVYEIEENKFLMRKNWGASKPSSENVLTS